jgi:mercuric ion transport protein
MSGAEDRARRFSVGGALVAAFAASSCCLGPLLLAALGFGGAGAAGAFGFLRPYLLAGTSALLAAAFYVTYGRPKALAAEACGCVHPRANRAGRFALWTATVLAKWSEGTRVRSSGIADRSLSKATLGVEGIDCEACAVPIRQALSKAGGFHEVELDIQRQSVTVTYEPAPGRLAAYVAAINRLGYEASVRDPSVAARGKP